MIRWGGVSLAGGALAFVAVFGYLAANFDYPAVLDGPAATVLPKLLATGATGRAVWTLYAFLPLLWVPAGIAAYEALAAKGRGVMKLAMASALVATVTMMLGLIRWPSVHWHLAIAFERAAPAEQAVLAAIFDGLNVYLGNFIGEFLGELAVNVFFLATALVWLRSTGPRWVGWLGVLTALAGMVGMLRNVTKAVALVAAVNNYLLPLFMVVLGVALMRWREGAAAPRQGPASTD